MTQLHKLILAALVLVMPAITSAQNTETKKVTLDTEDAKISYIFGLNVGNSLKPTGVNIDSDAFLKGLQDVLAGREPAMEEEAIQSVMLAFQTRMQTEQQQKMAEVEAKRAAEIPENQKLIANFQEDGTLKSTTSGLKYRIIKEGEGNSPLSSDTVKVHYKGILLDGKTFDSSHDRGEPAQFPVGGVIKGWTEALQLMKTGGKWQVLIPSELAYGANPPGGTIPPNASLFFEIELLDVL